MVKTKILLTIFIFFISCNIMHGMKRKLEISLSLLEEVEKLVAEEELRKETPEVAWIIPEGLVSSKRVSSIEEKLKMPSLAIGSYQCEECIFATNHAPRMKAHSIAHESMRNDPTKDIYCCELCGYLTYIKRSFQEHQDVHNKEKKYVCDIDKCIFKTNGARTFDRHIKIKHPDHQKL